MKSLSFKIGIGLIAALAIAYLIVRHKNNQLDAYAPFEEFDREPTITQDIQAQAEPLKAKSVNLLNWDTEIIRGTVADEVILLKMMIAIQGITLDINNIMDDYTWDVLNKVRKGMSYGATSLADYRNNYFMSYGNDDMIHQLMKEYTLLTT